MNIIIKKKDIAIFFLIFISLLISNVLFKTESTGGTGEVAKENIDEKINTNSIQDIEKVNFWNLTGSPIYINDWSCKYSWSKICQNDWCSGSGLMEDPYIIENIVIDGQNSSSCITITNSRAYFIIRNCTLYNSGCSCCNWGSGIKLINTRNGILLNNNCSYNNGNGILEICCNNNNFSKNTINYNSYHGISSWLSEYNNFLENEIKFNEINGIYFWLSNLNNINKNAIDYNQNGINFIFSNNNSVVSNYIVGNNVSIYQFMSRGNIFKNNKFEYELPPPILPEITPEEKDEGDEDDEKDESESQNQLLITLAIVGTSVGTMSGVAIGYLIHKKKFMKYIITSQIKPLKEKLKTSTITIPEEPIKSDPKLGLLPQQAIVKFADFKKSVKNNNLQSNESGVNKKKS